LKPKIERGTDQAERGEQGQLVGHRPEARLHRIAHRDVQHVQAAQQGPAQQHGGCECSGQQTEASLGQGVVGRLLMGRQGDGLREGSGHSIAVCRHMAGLACGQPEFHEQRADQHDGQRQGKSRRSHGRKCRAARMNPRSIRHERRE